MGLITLQRDIPQQKDHWFFYTANRHEDTKCSAYTSRTGKSNWFFMCSSIKKLLVAFHFPCRTPMFILHLGLPGYTAGSAQVPQPYIDSLLLTLQSAKAETNKFNSLLGALGVSEENEPYV